MRVGETVKTLPTVRPPKYANKEGVVTIADNEGEVQVRVGGGLAWFKPEELEAVGEQRTDSQRATRIDLRGETAPGQGLEPGGAGVDSRAVQPPRIKAQDSARWCDICREWGDHHTDHHPAPAIGSRGPNGGLYAVCEKCERVWERPKQRGRPAKVCPDCAR